MDSIEVALRIAAQQNAKLNDENVRLRAQCGALAENCVKHGSNITALEIEIDRLRAELAGAMRTTTRQMQAEIAHIRAELTAAQAREAKLREALRRCRFDSLNMSIGDRMTDNELLTFAAKAAGLNVDFSIRTTDGWITRYGGQKWNPLTDDGDALRLAVRLNIPVFPYEDETSTGTAGVVAKNWGSKEANTRRAIVRAAAEIGRSMK